jgi:hypothetical protein
VDRTHFGRRTQLTSDPMSAETPSMRDLTQRLIARESTADDALDGATSTHLAAERAYRSLSRWLGPAGCHALFTRALIQARTSNAVLGEVKLDARSHTVLNGVKDATRAYGSAAVAVALESLLVELLDLLGRLIGADMVSKLVEPLMPNDSDPDGSPK